jgi:hypothetical protein
MKPGFNIPALFLIGFVIGVFGIALVINPHYPRLILVGESSVATWMSGMLLVTCGTLCLVIANRTRWIPWLAFTTFFFVLAIDERFMIHEYIKQHLVFAYPDSSWIIREVAVIAGALGGGVVSIVLWRQLPGVSRYLLSGAVILGTASVVTDIADAGVLWEEIAKLLAEILITTALLAKISAPDIS